MKRHPDSLVIEFMGASGSGKSRLALELGERLKARGLPVRFFRVESHDPTMHGRPNARGRKAWWALRDAVLGPVSFTYAALGLYRARGGESKRFVKVLLSWWYNLASARALRGQPGIHLVDDGVFQTILNVMLNSERMDVADFILRQRRPLPLPDILVHVHACPSDILCRLDNRPALYEWLRKLGLQSTSHYLERYVAAETALHATRIAASRPLAWPTVLTVKNGTGEAWRIAEDLVRALAEGGHIR